jgi:hypothetical protein
MYAVHRTNMYNNAGRERNRLALEFKCKLLNPNIL